MRFSRTLSTIVLASLTVTFLACDDNQTPTQPTPTPTPTPPPQVTLTAPTPDAPGDDEQLTTLRPELRVNNATSNVSGTRTYEFQIADNANFTMTAGAFVATFPLVITSDGVAEGSDGKTTYQVQQDLQPATRYWWRARARQDSTVGSYSEARRVRTRVVGYNRPGELFDPLTDGQTVGRRVGSVTFLPGRGLRINDFSSYVEYRLGQTLASGEFSVIAEMPTRTPGDKTKVFSMYNGSGDIITSQWRCTVEKRSDGTIAWRFIAGGSASQIDTVGDERVRVDFGSGGPHFWKATWGGGFNLSIRRDNEQGQRIYNFGKTTSGAYNPNPHVAYLGAPIGRSGDVSASVPGAVYRNVWIGNRARPASLGTALEPDYAR